MEKVHEKVYEKVHSLNVRVTPADREALATLATFSPFSVLASSSASIIRYAIHALRMEMEKDGSAPATKKDLANVADKMASLIEEIPMAMPHGRGRPSVIKTAKSAYVSKAERESEEMDEGKRLCKLMDGNVEGEVCHYKKYEVTAGGFAVEYITTEHLANISEEMVAKRYDPSKVAWNIAKADDDRLQADRDAKK